jgi:hypothetical protein
MSYSEYQYTRVTFGRYRGHYLSEVPDAYVKWAVLNLADRAQAEMFAVELQRREPALRASATKKSQAAA